MYVRTPGALTLERGMGMCSGHDPFFQASRRSPAYQFTVNAPLLWPPFSIFRKFLDFQPCFGQNFSFLDPNLSKFSFPKTPIFQGKSAPRLPRPYILIPAWHIHQKKVECPPGRVHRLGVQKRAKLEKRCVFWSHRQVWKGNDGQFKKNACENAYRVYFHTWKICD